MISQKNTGTTDVVYTITYTDDNNCSTSIEYTVPTGSTCQPSTACTCDSMNLVLGTTAITLNSSSNSSGKTSISYDCEPYIRVSHGWLSANVRNGQIEVIATSANTSSSDRSGSIDFYDEQNGNLCGRISIVQKKAEDVELTINTAMNGTPFNTFVVRCTILKNGTQVYYESVGERNKSCEDMIYAASTTVNLTSTLTDKDWSKYTLQLSIENCHGWNLPCPGTTKNYSNIQWGWAGGTYVGSGVEFTLDSAPSSINVVALS